MHYAQIEGFNLGILLSLIRVGEEFVSLAAMGASGMVWYGSVVEATFTVVTHKIEC